MSDLDALANDLGVSRSEVVRLAVIQYLDFRSGRGANPNRVAEVVEFAQLVLDQVLRRDFPEVRDQVIDAVGARMGKYHGR